MRTRRPQPQRTDARPSVKPHAAGWAIGSDEIWACVPDDRDAQPVRSLGTFPPDLLARAAWRATCQMETVALESTGVDWLPVSALLEVRGFCVSLVHAHHLKQVPGRQSDVKDGQWMQYLHTYGLLSSSLRPEAERWAWRAS